MKWTFQVPWPKCRGPSQVAQRGEVPVIGEAEHRLPRTRAGAGQQRHLVAPGQQIPHEPGRDSLAHGGDPGALAHHGSSGRSRSARLMRGSLRCSRLE
jgi:hypothetical protein